MTKHKDETFQWVAALVGKQWKSLSEHEREPYDRVAAVDKARYHREKNEALLLQLQQIQSKLAFNKASTKKSSAASTKLKAEEAQRLEKRLIQIMTLQNNAVTSSTKNHVTTPAAFETVETAAAAAAAATAAADSAAAAAYSDGNANVGSVLLSLPASKKAKVKAASPKAKGGTATPKKKAEKASKKGAGNKTTLAAGHWGSGALKSSCTQTELLPGIPTLSESIAAYLNKGA